MTTFLVALQFLTILPIKIRRKLENEDFGKSLLYFPIYVLYLLFSLFTTIWEICQQNDHRHACEEEDHIIYQRVHRVY